MLEVLRKIGLSEKEAKLYLALIDFGEALPGAIADRAGIKRTTAYFNLNELVKKGLANKIKIKGYYHYQPLNPYKFLNKQSKIFQDFEALVPLLMERHTRFAVEPQISLHHGKEGIIQVMEDTLSSKGDILGWANIDEASTGYLKDYYPEYIRKKNEKALWVRAIFSAGPVARTFQKKGSKELREAYLVPKEKFPFHNEINIYDDKVSIISHQDKIAVLIHNKRIAETQRSIFQLSWIAAKSLDSACK